MQTSTGKVNLLKGRGRQVMHLDDFDDADIAAIKNVKPSMAATAFNGEMENQ